MRANHDLKQAQKYGTLGRKNEVPDREALFGCKNRPETPVNQIIRNDFGEGASAALQERYIYAKQHKALSKGLTAVRMTNAQVTADNHVRSKTQNRDAEARPEFKLKRFQNVDPRTSTKRGDVAYMSKKNAPQAMGAAFAQEQA